MGDAGTVGFEVLARLEELTALMTERIRAQVPSYGVGGLVPTDELRRVCRAHARHVLTALGGQPGGQIADEAPGRSTGRRAAERGIPLPDVMSAYRFGLTAIWEAVSHEAVDEGLSPTEIVALTGEVWELHDIFVAAVIDAYRDEVAHRVLLAEEEAAALLESLLEGRLDQHTLRETAALLRLPLEGPFVAVVAEVRLPGRHALVGVRDHLAALDLPSAWRLLPDGQVGLVRVGHDRLLAKLREFLSSGARQRIGVSPVFESLHEAAAAVRLARLAMASAQPGALVAGYHDDPLAIVSVAAPEVMKDFVHEVFSGLFELSAEERGVLLETLRTWVAGGGSANEAAAVLYVHPNTVRYRLKRIEERTGRSTSDPRQLTELCLAAEAELRQRDW